MSRTTVARSGRSGRAGCFPSMATDLGALHPDGYEVPAVPAILVTAEEFCFGGFLFVDENSQCRDGVPNSLLKPRSHQWQNRRSLPHGQKQALMGSGSQYNVGYVS